MNAVADNAYTRALASVGAALGRPRAVLCISAHWMTDGTWITHQASPRTIHDFHGFPPALYELHYAAPGDPPLAAEISREVAARAPAFPVRLDDVQWGFDHGAWSVLRHLFPAAGIPVLQLSLDLARPGADHYALGRALAPLRERGILILGSGNIVHNLRLLKWDESAAPHPWAIAFDTWVAERLAARDDTALVEKATATEEGRLSIPTAEHWLPLLYVLGAAGAGEEPVTLFDGIQNASISMRSVGFGMPS